jgi:hypothetical protein
MLCPDDCLIEVDVKRQMWGLLSLVFWFATMFFAFGVIRTLFVESELNFKLADAGFQLLMAFGCFRLAKLSTKNSRS